MTTEKADLWCELLSDLSPSSLAPAFEQAAKTCTDFPTVADIRKAAAEIAEAKRAELRTSGERTYGQEECPWCGGSGWEIDGRDFLEGKFPTAIRCRCRQPGFILPPPKPRKMLTEADRSAIAASLGLRTGEE